MQLIDNPDSIVNPPYRCNDPIAWETISGVRLNFHALFIGQINPDRRGLILVACYHFWRIPHIFFPNAFLTSELTFVLYTHK